jgi:hypothetical protein
VAEVVLEPTFPFSGRIEKFKDAGYFHDISMSWSLESGKRSKFSNPIISMVYYSHITDADRPEIHVLYQRLGLGCSPEMDIRRLRLNIYICFAGRPPQILISERIYRFCLKTVFSKSGCCEKEYKPIIILDYYEILHLAFTGTLALLRRGLLIKKVRRSLEPFISSFRTYVPSYIRIERPTFSNFLAWSSYLIPWFHYLPSFRSFSTTMFFQTQKLWWKIDCLA